MDCSPPGSSVHGILQARMLEWVAISFSNAWKWKAKVKSLSRVRLLATSWTAAYQAPLSMGFSSKNMSRLTFPSLGDLSTQELNPGFLHCRQILYHLGNEGSPENCIMSWFNWGRIISEYSTAGFPGGSDGKEPACSEGNLGSIPGSGRSPGKRYDHPLQYSCLENSMDRRAWQATVHGVTKSQTWLSNQHTYGI